MRRLFPGLFLFLTLSLAAQTVAPVAHAPENENSKKARAILNQMIDALGGQAWLNIKDMRQEGRTYSFYQGKPNSVGTTFVHMWKFPDKDRTEFPKAQVVLIVNGDKGYETTYKGTAAAEEDSMREFLRRRNHSLETVLREWLPDPKTALFYDGPAVAEQKYCDQVTLLSSTDDSVTLFIDTHTHLPVKKTFDYRDPLDRLKTPRVKCSTTIALKAAS